MRSLGKTGAQVSALGVGGHHLGQATSEEEAERIVAGALDAGLNFFDNCWEYHNGKSEVWLGRALAGKRDKAFLMTKVCTHGRGADLALEMLEQSLRRLRTDHLDLWQIHGMGFENDPERAFKKGGVIEAMDKAKQQGLPELVKHGIACLGMKPFTGKGEPIKSGVVTPEEMLRYAMSLPGVAVTITGMESTDRLKQNVGIARGFEPLDAKALQAIRNKCVTPAGDGRFELYKVSLKYDNPEARRAHDFPIDAQQMEVKEQLDYAVGKDSAK
jgi:aryl-alcohol dehydrogenase-like predicted oxidoreductase